MRGHPRRRAHLRGVHRSLRPEPAGRPPGLGDPRDRGVQCFDFDADLRDELDTLNGTFDGHFLRRNGPSGKARFDHTQNGGGYELATDEGPSALVWTTRWSTRGRASMYANGRTRGSVALARFAKTFHEVHDPAAYDFAGHSAALDVGNIAVYGNRHGHALVRLLAVEPPRQYGGTPHISVTIDYELRPHRPVSGSQAGPAL